MSRVESTSSTSMWPDCPVGVRAIPAEELNKPRRGDTLIDSVQIATQSAHSTTHSAQISSQSARPGLAKTA
jgi:hypothetical protein